MVIATRVSHLDDQNLPFCSIHIMLMVTWRSIDQSHKSHNALHDLISPNTPFRTEIYTFLFWMVHWGIWDKCIGGFVNLVYCCNIQCTVHLKEINSNYLSYQQPPIRDLGLLWQKYGYGSCFILGLVGYKSISLIFFRSSSLILGQLYDCPEPVKQPWM